MRKVGLILEGGGLRGIYTSGVLDFFMEKNLYFPYVIGVSAGALNALSYLSRQIGRSKDIAINLTKDKRLINRKNLITNKDVFGFDFYFNEVSREINPFDYETFKKSKEELVVVCTDCEKGMPIYYKKNNKYLFDAVKASSTLPILNSTVIIEDKHLLDGAIIDPIPIKKAIEDGFLKNVLVLTNEENYVEKEIRYKMLFKRKYSDYENLLDILNNRHKIYNNTLQFINELYEKNEVFIIRPSKKLKFNKYKRNEKKQRILYELGYNDAKNNYESLKKWLSN